MPGFSRQLDQQGRLPAVKLEVQPLEGKPYTIERFISYNFNSNILIPVDTFTFTFKPAPPKSERETYDKLIKEGDLVQLTVAGKAISTGYVDSISIDTDNNGSRMTVFGRDLMGMLEDNDAVNPDATIMYAGSANILEVISVILKGCRIRNAQYRNVASDVHSLFATYPGESKLAALQRFMDPLNAIAWMSAGGEIIIGKPSFDAPPSGTIGIRQMGTRRMSNVLSMRVMRAAGQIPNAVAAVWQGLEGLQSGFTKNTFTYNQAEGPSRLFKAGHKIYRCLPTGRPEGGDSKDGLTEAQRIIAQGGNYLDSLEAREIARSNVAELTVSATVSGHMNDNDEPYSADQTYDVVHDAAGISKKMYLSGVDYSLTEDAGQITSLTFINLNTIVAQGPVK